MVVEDLTYRLGFDPEDANTWSTSERAAYERGYEEGTWSYAASEDAKRESEEKAKFGAREESIAMVQDEIERLRDLCLEIINDRGASDLDHPYYLAKLNGIVPKLKSPSEEGP